MVLRRDRSADDIDVNNLNLLLIVENKLTFFFRPLHSKMKSRLENNKDHASNDLIETISKCLNFLEILKKGVDDEEFNTRGNEHLKMY